MGEAMIRGLLDQCLARAQDLVVADVAEKRRSQLHRQYNVAAEEDSRIAAEKADTVVLAIKPVSLHQVMRELRGNLKPDQLVISIVAGATLTEIRRGLDHQNAVRAMPSMPAQISAGISIWTAPEGLPEDLKERAASILSALGKQIYVKEEQYIDMATAVSGGGPAFVFLIMEAFIDAAVHIGLPRELARDLVLETFLGSTRLILKGSKHPAELRNQVTSPAGTTTEGLLQLEEGGLRALLMGAVIASYRKAKTLKQE